jgi:hypothetical protein
MRFDDEKMNKDLFEERMKERFFKELAYYEKKSGKNKNLFYAFQIIVILFSVLTPLLLAYNNQLLEWAAIITSGVVTIFTALLGAFKFQENWINYRTVAESLKKEMTYYTAKLCDYENSPDPEQLFLLKIENLISKEHTSWITCQAKTGSNK